MRMAGTVGSRGSLLPMLAGRSASSRLAEAKVYRGQSVITSDALPVCQGLKTSRHSTTNVLGDLLAQMAIQWLRVAAEGCAVMRDRQRRDQQGRVPHSVRRRWSRRAKAHCKAGGGCGERQERLCETFLIDQGQADDLRVLNGLLRCVPRGRDHEIGHGTALNLGRALEHRMQIAADAGFETGGRRGRWRGFVLLMVIMRQIAVQMKTYG